MRLAQFRDKVHVHPTADLPADEAVAAIAGLEKQSTVSGLGASLLGDL